MIKRTAIAMLVGLTLTGGLSLLVPPEAEAQGPQPPRPRPLPLPAARKATFTATKGTWMSVDVSPDGKTLVFDLLGDIYTMPIGGGKATRITEGMAFDAQPRWSPDGESIVFISDRSGGDNVWTMRLDFTDTVQVTQGNNSLYASPEWMPDGQHVVVSRSGGLGGAAKIEMYHVRRRGAMPVIRAPATLKTLGAAPTPDGRYLWFAGRSGDWQYNASFPQYQLYVYDRERGTTTLQSLRYGSGFRPAVSPDGKLLAYGTRFNAETGLRLRDLATGEERWLAYPIQRDEQESRATLDVLPGYSFTPDSREIVISYGGEIWRVPVDGAAPTRVPFEAAVSADIGPEVRFRYRVDTTAMVTARQIRSPVTSPDGKRIIFTAFDRLWVGDLATGTSRRVSQADVGEFHPVWSPDGAWVAYVTWDDSVGGHIMKARSDGVGAIQQLTRVPALYYNLAWSPDGQRLVATRGAARDLKRAPDVFFGPQGGEFVWVPAAGGSVNLIAPTGTRDVAHFNRSEPERIYAYSPLEGLVSFRWDGTDVKQHLQVRGAPPPIGGTPHPEEYRPWPRRVFPLLVEKGTGLTGEADPPAEAGGPPAADLVMISPTGERVVAQVGNHIYMAEIPRVGGPVPVVSVAVPAAAPVRVRQLTDIGGEFPSWSADGKRIHWAIGNAFASYDLSRVETIEDSVAREGRATVGRALRVRQLLDTLRTTRRTVDSLNRIPAPVPDSIRARLNRLLADSIQARADSLIRAADLIRARALAARSNADSVRAGLDSVRADTVTYKPVERRVLVQLPRDVPRGSVVLRGARVLTMRGHQIIENADVVVTDNRIVAVGRRDSVTVPAGARVIDVAGKTIIPGFVDTHYHPQWLVPEIHTRQAWQYLATLAYGVTTTRDPQTASTDVLSYQDRVAIGAMVGPRIYSTGPGVFINENIRDSAHAMSVLKRYSQYYDTKTLKMYMSGNRQQRQWIIQAARILGLMPTTEGGLDYKLDLTHVKDGYPGVEHALPVAPIYEDVVKLFKAAGTTNSPTLLVSYGGPFAENWFYAREEVHDDPKLRRFVPEESIDIRTRRRPFWALDEEQVFPKHAEFVRRMLADTARVAVGSHGQIQGVGYLWEVWAMGSGGAPPHDVLRAATVLGAEAIGMGTDLGTIEAGKLADLLVLDADPLQDLRNIARLQYVMKDGRLYEAGTLNEVWPVARPLPTPHWRNLGPDGVRAGVRGTGEQ